MHFTFTLLSLCLGSTFLFAQNPLLIPSSLTGTSFNLSVQSGTTIFYDTISTPTFGINGVWMSPTIIVNKGDSITLNVTNNLNVKTTMHWHGLHVAAKNDGGPHQEIAPAATWSPSYRVRNQASTFWYHPHGAAQTELQVSKGLAGFFIVRDSAEAALNLPRTYGVDDIPVVVQTRAFDVLKQIAIADHMDTAVFANGTLDATWNAPGQVVRFRLLNGSSLRTFRFGFSNNITFYQIATDGGLMDSSFALTRLTLSPGERAEILIDFAPYIGQNFNLTSFSTELPTGIYGADSVGMGADSIQDYDMNFLNGSDFDLLRINAIGQTANPVTSIATALIPYQPFDTNSVNNVRTILMDTLRILPADVPSLVSGPFGLNGRSFDIDSVNEIIFLNSTEIWTLVNRTSIAHPFHMHAIQFNILEKGGILPPASERGWKDVVLVMPGDSVKFITQFTTFADNTTPYMYHCHLLHHEDDGMMGSFLVIDTTVGNEPEMEEPGILVTPNPSEGKFTVKFHKSLQHAAIRIIDVFGNCKLNLEIINKGFAEIDLGGIARGIYFLVAKSGSWESGMKIIVR